MLTFPEGDRHLVDRPPAEPGTHDELDLEAVAVGVERLRDEVLEQLATVDAVAARRIVQGDPEHHGGVDVAHPRQREPYRLQFVTEPPGT